MKPALNLHDSATDKLFITEILNDLYRHDFVRGGKAEVMLRAWAWELRDEARVSFPASRPKRVFTAEIGKENW